MELLCSAALYWKITNQLLIQMFWGRSLDLWFDKAKCEQQVIDTEFAFQKDHLLLVITSLVVACVFQINCGVPAPRCQHAHVWCLSLLQVGGRLPGYLQRLLYDGRSHGRRHCPHILFVKHACQHVKKKANTRVLLLSSVLWPLTRRPRHQVHQAALLPAAGDGALLPHVLEHLPAGWSLRLHRWAASDSGSVGCERSRFSGLSTRMWVFLTKKTTTLFFCVVWS